MRPAFKILANQNDITSKIADRLLALKILGGVSRLSLISEVVLPKLTHKTEEYRTAGMDTPIDIELGTEKLTLEYTVSEFNSDLLTLWGLMQGGDRGITLRGLLENEYTMDRLTVQGFGRVREIDPGTLKVQEKNSIKLSMGLLYYKLSMGNKDLIEIDVINHRRVINGFDQLLLCRANLGV